MFSLTRRHLISGLLVAATLVAPRLAGAQLTDVTVQREADRLHELAMAELAYSTPEQLLQTVRLHSESARLRLASDPRAVECNQLQASLLYLVGEYGDARVHLERAAGLAIAKGDPAAAAHLFVNAAHMAEREGQTAEAQRLGQAAHLLYLSPSLTKQERALIRQRFN